MKRRDKQDLRRKITFMYIYIYTITYENTSYDTIIYYDILEYATLYYNLLCSTIFIYYVMLMLWHALQDDAAASSGPQDTDGLVQQASIPQENADETII